MIKNLQPSRPFLFFLTAVFLISITLFTFWGVKNCEFTVFDDSAYVSKNTHVAAGLTPENVLWAFRSMNSGNWHPLTWLTYMLLHHVLGLNPVIYHMANLALHTLNVLLLFGVLLRMSGCWYRSIFVAALFAIHPMHVESVAWVSELKDMLYTFFWLLGMLSYLNYARSPAKWRYLITLGLFALGLMSKPMMITFPFVLLLLDYWPLGRVTSWRAFAGLVKEKLLFLLFIPVSGALTLWAQQNGGPVSAVVNFPLGVKLSNVVTAYGKYIGKMLWPVDLTALYPHPRTFPPLPEFILITLALVLISAFCIKWAKKCPYLLFGWLWFIITLLPVIGIIQVGIQAIADRYSYVPYIGLFIAFAWGLSDLAARSRIPKWVLALAATVILIACSLGSQAQVRYWKTSVILFSNALRISPNSAALHRYQGEALIEEERGRDAETELRKSIAISPKVSKAHALLGTALAMQGKPKEALKSYKTAAELNPYPIDIPFLFINAGLTLSELGRYDEAIKSYQTALKQDPKRVLAHYYLAWEYVRQEDYEKAIEHYEACIRINPTFMNAYYSLAKVYDKRCEIEKAIRYYEQALKRGYDPSEIKKRLQVLEPLRNKLPDEQKAFCQTNVEQV